MCSAHAHIVCPYMYSHIPGINIAYIHTYICNVCMHTYTHVMHEYTHIHACMHACMHTYMHKHIPGITLRSELRAWPKTLLLFTLMSVSPTATRPDCPYMYVCKYVCAYVYMRVCVCVRSCVANSDETRLPIHVCV